MDKNNNSDFSVEKEIDIGYFIRLILLQSKLVLLIVFLIFGLGITSYLTSEKVYQVKSLLQVTSNQAANIGQNTSLNFLHHKIHQI